MKTIFALLGLFMFASVSSTDIKENTSVNNDQPVLTESGGVNGTDAGGKRVIIIL